MSCYWLCVVVYILMSAQIRKSFVVLLKNAFKIDSVFHCFFLISAPIEIIYGIVTEYQARSFAPMGDN